MKRKKDIRAMERKKVTQRRRSCGGSEPNPSRLLYLTTWSLCPGAPAGPRGRPPLWAPLLAPPWNRMAEAQSWWRRSHCHLLKTSNRGHEEWGSDLSHGDQLGVGWWALTLAGVLAFPGCDGLLACGPFCVFTGVGLGIFQLRPRSHGLQMENRV